MALTSHIKASCQESIGYKNGFMCLRFQFDTCPRARVWLLAYTRDRAYLSRQARWKAGRSKTSFAPDCNSKRSFVILLNGAKAWKRLSRAVMGMSSALRRHMSRASSRFHPVGSCAMSSTNFCSGSEETLRGLLHTT